MANKIILKKTSTASKVPLSTDLEVGEIAVNLADQKLYSKNASGTVILVGQGTGGAGDVTGPTSSTDNALARYDGTTGKVIQNSTVVLDDNGNLSNVNAVGFDTTPTTPPTATGSMYWDNGNQTPTVVLNANTDLQLGQENIALVYNGTGSTIAKGSVVAVSGAQGQRPSVVLADADSEALSASTLGITAEAIANGAEGFVCTFGLVRGINTSAFTAGQAIYLSQTAGAFTATRPSAPAHTVALGYVISINASSGEVFVNINNGWELDELHNVLITSPTSGNTLIYDAVAGVWENANITGSTGLSVTNGAGTIALANTGVTSAVAGTGISVSGATGAVTITNTAPDQTVSLTQGGATTITGTYPNFTISSVNTTYSQATSTTLGLIELASDTVQSTAANAVTSTASRSYGLQVNAAGQGVVNVPWTDTTYSLATSTVLGLIELGSDTVQTVAPNAVTATASRSYALQVNSAGQGVINVPWTDTVYTLPTATTTVLGGIELGSDTVQTVAPNAVTATASRSYALQLNSSGQAVVNVPWTDTNSGGTVTSVSALTLGTTGTDLSSTVANGTTTPVITLNVPTASATNRGVLSSTDWTTFNNKYSTGGALGTPSSGTLTNCTGLPVGGISATGTPSASTYLRGDGSWATVSGGSGTVTSVAISGTNISVDSGSPITTSGTIAISIPQAVGTSSSVQFGSFGVGTAASGTTGEIRATNNITAYFSSDRNLKENIKDVDNALEIVCSIGSKTFDWTDEYIEQHGGNDGYFVTKQSFGVIAQDVQEVFPQAVRTREDGTLAVDYEKLAVLSFGAIKELVNRIEKLEGK